MNPKPPPINPTSYRNQVMATQPHPLRSLDALAVLTTYHRGQEICGESRPAEHWYCIISGAARRYVLRADGRRQIVGLLLPGDFVGFSAGDQYDFTVEAIAEGTVVASYPRRRVELLADSDPQVARELRQVAFEGLARLQAQLLTLGRITATEKVSAFILEMAQRATRGRDDSVALLDNLRQASITFRLADAAERCRRPDSPQPQDGLPPPVDGRPADPSCVPDAPQPCAR